MRRAAAILLIVATTAISPQGTPTLRRGLIFTTWSSMDYVTESGDVIGTEITVVPQYLTAYVIFQCTEGAPSSPILLPAKTTATSVDFTVPESPDQLCPGHYVGNVTPKGLALTMGTSHEILPRRKSYWAH